MASADGTDAADVPTINRLDRMTATATLMLPSPIEPARVEQWTWLLNASDAQRELMRQLFAEYRAAEFETFRAHITPMLDEFRFISSRGRIDAHPDLVDALNHLLETRGVQAIRAIDRTEEQFFQSLRTHLIPSQQQMLDGIARFRNVQRYRIDERVPAGGTDLLELAIEQIIDSEDDLAPVDRAAFAAVALQYLSEAAELFAQRRDADVRTRTQGLRVFSEMYDASDGLTNREADENLMLTLREHRQKLHRERTKREQHVARMNSRFIESFRAVLPEESADRLVALYVADIYPPVYPDPTDIDDVFAAVLAHDALKPETERHVRALQTATNTRRAAVNREMIEAFESWRVGWSMTRTTTGFSDYRETAESLDEARRELALNSLHTLEQFLALDVWPDVAETAAAAQQRIKEADINVDPRIGYRLRQRQAPPSSPPAALTP